MKIRQNQIRQNRFCDMVKKSEAQNLQAPIVTALHVRANPAHVDLVPESVHTYRKRQDQNNTDQVTTYLAIGTFRYQAVVLSSLIK
ncbi:hypothetical protein A2154_01190 [Candidatus Gottesmanbacteria bacterium RBG_16_43_7]|uniref:Uncharacterized protein n=1 Tax=Candidatus Gottesmanbacteria bacterium RBG_16_43_7 TaxID=1798373 RepID=A0A1F5ZAP7_9BACT|nr:MAG: hypothetical protein A2154_01190 [Candidatus Gottesmanbacteria bacterium RBG_16_43_7]